MDNTERFQIRYIYNDYCYIRNNVPLSEVEEIISNNEFSSLIVRDNYGKVVYKKC